MKAGNALVLKLAFADRIQYDRFEGAITPEISFPFKSLGGITDPQVCFGAPEENNLEPFECELLLSELETWTEILKAEPDVIHRLEALAQGDDEPSQTSSAGLPEPSP